MTLKSLVVIPAYNEALNIKKTISDIHENAPEIDYIIIQHLNVYQNVFIC